MSDAGQSAERLRTSLHKIASWIGIRRSDESERGEDLLADAESDLVEFTSLSPFTKSRHLGRLFSLLSDTWIRRHCDPFLFERAKTIVNNSSVVLVAAGDERLAGKVCDIDVFSVEIWFEHGRIVGSCQCDSYRRHKETATSGDQRLACAHIVALTHYLVGSGLIPRSAPGDQAALCPVTRQTLDEGRMIYRCVRCHLSFSAEGWQFLKEMDRGRCCGCQGRNCIHLVSADQEESHAGAIS